MVSCLVGMLLKSNMSSQQGILPKKEASVFFKLYVSGKGRLLSILYFV